MPTHDEQPGATRSDLSGSAGDVVQARDVAGGIHFHGLGRRNVPVPAQLPGDVRGFVNRTADLSHLDTVLGDGLDRAGTASVCVIVGTAGVGKTSLAVRWAHRNRHRFPDGQLYINLRGYDPSEPVGPAQALERFLTALGIAPGMVPADLEDRAALFRSVLADRRVLVVLDNAVSTVQVRPLLSGAGRCLVLVTSRSRLSGLVSRDSAHRVTLDVFAEPEAVELLRSATADYRTGDERNEFIELARLCARLPLALRIAAERAAARPQIPMGDLIDNLRDESRLWDALSAEDDDEADAVRTVFAWSYRALPAKAARMFRLLGLHPGPDLSLHVAAALAGVTEANARQQLDVLVGAHLVEQVGNLRYQFHGLLHAYANDRANYDEVSEVRLSALHRCCNWYLYTMNAARSALGDIDIAGIGLRPDCGVRPLSFIDREQAESWLEVEVDNLMAVTRKAAHERLDDIGWRLSMALFPSYVVRHSYFNWLPLGLSALACARRASDHVGEASVLIGLGASYRLLQRIPEAIDSDRLALEIAHSHGDRERETLALRELGLSQVAGRHFNAARETFKREVALLQQAGDTAGIAIAHYLSDFALFEAGYVTEAYALLAQWLETPPANYSGYLLAELKHALALMQYEMGYFGQALAAVEDAIKIAHAAGGSIEGLYEVTRGRILLALRQPDSALVALQRAAVILQRDGNRGLEAQALDAIGEVYQALDRLEEAADFYRRAADVHRDLKDKWGLAGALHDLARALNAMGLTGEALRHYEEVLQLIAEYGDTRAVALRTQVVAALKTSGVQ